MSKSKSEKSLTEFEHAAAERANARYVLRLYVTGLTPRSVAAVASVKQTCEEHLQGRYELEVVNLYDQPTLAKGEQILAAPTLIKKLPLPLRRIIGDMADTRKLLVGLDLREKETKPEREAVPLPERRG
jgi:circadian clock protein KaiB